MEMKRQSGCILIIFSLLFIYAMDNFLTVSIKSSPVYIYLCKPVTWTIIIFIILSFQRVRPAAKLRFKNMLKWWAVLLGAVYIMVMMLGGIIEGFGKSPYSFSLPGIMINILFVFTTLAGREFARGYLTNSLTHRKYVFGVAIIAVFMTLLEVQPDTVNKLETRLDIIKYIGQDILPGLSDNIMATYLVYLGGPALSIIYLGIQQCFYWFFPILPNINWITKTLIGTLCPFFSLMFMQYVYFSEAQAHSKSTGSTENPLAWIVTSVVSVSIIWFAVGVFPIYPSVIATGSMEPLIHPGDIVLVKRIDIKNLKLGDVIQYKKDNIYIFHRLIKITEDDGRMLYQTKGDNNSIPDPELVKSSDIKGKVVYIIPKAGWPTLLLKRRDEIPESSVEY